MKARQTLAWLILSSLPALAGDKTIPINDLSSADSPVRSHGSVTVAQETSGDALLTSSSQDWIVKNVSAKDIVALSESLVCVYPDGRKGGRSERYELFFHPQVMKSGEEVAFSEPSSVVERTKRLGIPPVEPRCEANALWVQFSDGSTFGDKAAGDSLLSDRRVTMKGLYVLRDVYLQSSADQFIQMVQTPPDSKSALMYVNLKDQLKDYYNETKDIQGTYNKLKAWIDTAESRQRLLD